ncbi:MAG: PorT family protein [Muribaculaceae bacterium]|nr:PorT family protein [Muribaculaceae bacterium]
MKRLLLIFIMAMCLSSARGQVENTRPLWGVKAAVDVNIPGKWHGAVPEAVDMYRAGAGVSAGVVYNVYLGHNFFLEPGVSFFYDTYSFKDLIIMDDNEREHSAPGLYKAGLRIPVVAGYLINMTDRFAMTVYTGPELNYAFAGKVKVKDNRQLDGSDLELFGEYGSQHRVDCAWRVGVGLPVGSWTINLEGSIGITDLMKGPISFRENRFSAGLTYYF